MNNINQKDKEYVVVIKAGSRLRFNPGESLQVQVNIGEHRCLLTYQTRYCEEGFESPIPRELWIEARGTAPSLNSAIETFTNTSQLFVNLISFCTNAYAGESEFHLAFDNTSGVKEREFFQQFIKEERELPPLSRKIKPELITTVIDALGKHEHKDRLIRAIVQYVLALGHWKRGSEILATAHLFMGMESLVPVIREVELANKGLKSTQELADHWSIPLSDLDSRIRRDIIFQADYDCHRDAKRASDGVEHGFLSFDEIRPLAQDVRDKTATYQRTAIIKLLHLAETEEQDLLDPPSSNPMETISYIRYFRGHLLSEHDQLAPVGQEYPFMDWKVTTKSFSISDDKKFHFSFSESIRPRLGDKVSLNLGTFEVYGPKGIDVDPPPEWKKVEPEIIKSDPDRERLFALLERVEKVIIGYGPKDFFEATLSDMLILPMYSRCRSLFQGVVALLKKELPEEALILGRSLFIESLRLAELAEAQDRRMAKMLGWANKSIKFDMRMLKEAAKVGLEKNIDSVMQKLKDRKSKLRQHAKQQGIRKLRKFESVKKATTRYSSPENYFTYLFSGQMVDGTITAHMHRAHQVEEGKIRVESVTQDIKFIGGVGAFATEAVLLACRAAGMIFGWPELEDLEDLLRESTEWHNTAGDRVW